MEVRKESDPWATIETGPGGNDYVYSSAAPQDGGVITSYILVDNTDNFIPVMHVTEVWEIAAASSTQAA